MVVKRIDLAYVAGIIDGEGCIRLGKRNKKNGLISYYIGVEVGMTNEWIIQWLRFNFGGSVFISQPKGNRKTRYNWSLRTKSASDFIKLILPYLKIKKPQAELVLKFQSRRKYRGNPDRVSIGTRIMSDEEAALDEADKILMGKYNKRGLS